MNPEIFDVPSDDQDEQEFDEDRLHRIWEVLDRDWLFYQAPQDLIDDDVFHELEFDPTRAEIEEVQWRHLNK